MYCNDGAWIFSLNYSIVLISDTFLRFNLKIPQLGLIFHFPNKFYRPNFKQKTSFPFLNSAATGLVFLPRTTVNYQIILIFPWAEKLLTVDLKLCSEEDVEGHGQGLYTGHT